ncbi:MAG: M28 family peptidase [Deltaproteobacteria bacterium]|nr:M28 family peptidase [Deltaproteobacteria bacterium]
MKHFLRQCGVFSMPRIRKNLPGYFPALRLPSAFWMLSKRLMLMTGIALIWLSSAGAGDFERDIRAISAFGDRGTGTSGCRSAAEYIKDRFQETGFSEIGAHRYSLPILQQGKSRMAVPDRGITLSLHPFIGNAISPQAIDPQGLKGPLIYAGAGTLTEFNGKSIEGAILLMELDSGKNWIQAASLGAKAVVYVDRGLSSRTWFEEKLELSPIQFPRFWISLEEARNHFGEFETALNGLVFPEIRLNSEVRWKEVAAENIYCLIPGRNANLQEELMMIEAFYDSTAYVPGLSPGADEAVSIATLLELARKFKETPPERSVLLVATSGHAQSLAGLRDLVWSLRTSPKDLRKQKKQLRDIVKDTRKTLSALDPKSQQGAADSENSPASADAENAPLDTLVKKAISDEIKTRVDVISRELMQLRLQEPDPDNQGKIQKLAKDRRLLRQLGWQPFFKNLSPEEKSVLDQLMPSAILHQQAILRNASSQAKLLDNALEFRSIVKNRELMVSISLHLSSHGDGFGAFSQGWLYPLKANVNRSSVYTLLDGAMHRGGEAERSSVPLFRDTLRPSKLKTWQTYFTDRPFLGGEVTALAGYIGASLATVHDARDLWGTPHDVPSGVDWTYATEQSRQVCSVISRVASATELYNENLPQNGFSTISGRASFIRHGELFADQPAPGTVILSYQGNTRYHAMVGDLGTFQIKGVADKRHVLDKVIIEGYRFDPETGNVLWAIDKEQTGKEAYRLKMQRTAMQTDLIMFACKGTTLFNLMEPRSFKYLTKINLIDGRREAAPLKYWYSRIDTRSSVLTSIFLEPETRLKLTLSDSVLHKKLILTHADPGHSEGTGYRIDDWPVLHQTEFRAARDMWALLNPRITNLENHGIFNEQIRRLQQEGQSALKTAEQTLADKKYDQFIEASSASWALASRVYDDVEQTQKDVLFGVLFYIALFVPFAFCMERLLFSFSNIYKRIIAFSVILVLVIGIIYQVHPAFQLAYSPLVVILAFFIIGLSFMVTLIVFLRFEAEMNQLQNRARPAATGDITRWKAFTASFFLGVSNLRRRRIRTALTCATLIILTFTIMSFTSVKSMRLHSRIQYQAHAPYSGFLLKNVNWQDIPQAALPVLTHAFDASGIIAPRVWLEGEDRTRSTEAPLRYDGRIFEAQGMIGLSADEPGVTGLDQILVAGRWFRPEEHHVVLVSDRMARDLGIPFDRPESSVVQIWGIPFQVAGIFSGKLLQDRPDLDGEPLTPAIFPREASQEITEVEMEAMESGDDVRSYQSRYQHISGDLTLIVPSRTLLSSGGKLKGIAVRHTQATDTRKAAQHLVDRFGLALFSGEPDGVLLYNASDALSYSGVPNILIPIIISICIVLNTMIGSVYERKREIAIYTSVGLAPSHVSFLFIAEAMAFAVLSVVMGYLLAQTSASLFAGTSLWSGITVNYSSLSGVAAMILVILVVLISAIYPSRVAAEIAIPDVNRSWTLPASKGNLLEITLPFLMKYPEHRSITGFLYDYFKGHQDVSHGLFSTGEITFSQVCPVPPVSGDTDTCEGASCCKDACIEINAHVWLAPFDFGIMQQVILRFCQSREEPGFLEVNILLERQSGESNAWRRINKSFLHAVRRQLLMWRSLNPTAQDHYEKLLTDELYKTEM